MGQGQERPEEEAEAEPARRSCPRVAVGRRVADRVAVPAGPARGGGRVPPVRDEIARIDEAFEAATADIEEEFPADVVEEIQQHRQDPAAEEAAYQDGESDLFDELAHAEFDDEEAALEAAVERAQAAQRKRKPEPEPEDTDLDGEQDEADNGLARPGDLPADDEPEPETPEALAAKAIKLYEPDDEDEGSDMPELTEEILAKMFANMMAAGQWSD